MPISVAVAGASGYAGGELLRLLADHPEFEVRTVTAHQNAGQALSAVHPHLTSIGDLVLQPTEPSVLAEADVVFLALPHGASGAITAELPDDVLVVDCGADHRLTDETAWAAFYGGEYHGAWTYGMPELLLDGGTAKQRDNLVGTTRIAVPGCNVTAITLGLAPGIAAGVIEPHDLVSVLAVGTSGAGKSLRHDLLASEIMGSASAYAVGGIHRHTPEIVQNLTAAGGDGVTISFTPVLVPMARGILATSTARLAPGVSASDVREAWLAAYAGERFVRVLPEGSFPRTSDTTGANTALMGIAIDEAAGRVVVVSAIDNLVKGTAGAAIQSANIAAGLPESLGLPLNGVAP
ncbi:N-acetyl-gamma-glutamyl-phosphate reductase [Homoserinibacter sp. GY 40078]|uniref:N-acetyl-gamma-glutamyl-phosphate reductase n=1 Tax=Homoserinibacter sp. GY 40078 TaxID=2603275 RepID=UPI0011CAACD8|nr:N-acetyl-gamma-glutamyl-phosphate reductase [Homoserinibacter sp. GY 40078]TXK19865.1 N-acetyl-gamma-glutamyl-phosphate reductase [Homoserinibacter sp. GY 40078]